MKTLVLSLAILFPCFQMYAQWEPTGGPHSGNVRALKSNSDYAFASFSNGLYRTGNGGESWDKLAIGQAENYNAVHFNLSETSLLVLIQAHGAPQLSGLYRSDDHGDSWMRINEPALPLAAISKLMIFEGKLFLQTYYDEAIFSTDNGLSWLPVEIIEPDSQRFYSDFEVFDGNLYIGGQGRINKLPSGSDSWEIISLPVSQMPVEHFFIYGDTIMAGNPAITFRSEDGGQSWEQTDESAFEIVHLDGVLYRRGFPLHKSADFGKTWEYVPSDYDEDFLSSQGLAINQGNLLVGDYSGGVYRTENLGFNWHRASNGIYNSAVNAMVIADGFLFTASYGKSIDRYDLSTGRWNGRPLFEWVYGMTDIVWLNGALFASGWASHDIFRSFNNGQSWDTLNFGYDFYERLMAGDNLLIAWGEDTYEPAISTENQGNTWQDYAEEIREQVGFSVDEFRSGDGVLYGYSGMGYNMAISTDGGHHWEAVEREQDAPFLAGLTAGGDILLKGHPILPGSPEISWDYGATFHPTNGLPSRIHTAGYGNPIQQLALVEGNYILATSSGLFVSNNGGLNWAPLPHDMPTNQLRTICYYQDTVYVGTTLYGVWKAPFSSLPVTPVSTVVDGLPPGGNTESFQVIPNPASGAFTIRLKHSDSFQGQLLICNGTGQLILSQPVQFRNQLIIPEPSLPPGYYQAILQSKQQAYTCPLIIQR